MGTRAVSTIRPSPIPQIQTFSSMEEGLAYAGIPPPAMSQLEPFMSTLNSYETSTNHVQQITGRKPKSVSEFVFSNPRPFLPRTFTRLMATGKAPSFREAAVLKHDCCLEDELDRQLESDELLISVRVAGVNGGADTFSVTNVSEDSKEFPLGNEGTGIVVAVGGEEENSSNEQFKPGDTAVFIGQGAYGEYVRVKAALCAKIPESMLSKKTKDGATASLIHAELTALRISALTALVALTRTCPVEKGDVVLVTACCGGTGHFAAQIAKSAGAKSVIGTVGSSSKVTVANNLGCLDRVVDLSTESLDHVLQNEFPKGVDICYEGVGGSLLKAVHDNLALGGRILVVGSISQYPHNDKDKIEAHNVDEIPDDIMKDVFRAGKTLDLDRDCKIIGNVWGDLFKSGEMGVYRDKVFELWGDGKLDVLLDPENVFYGVGSVCDAVDHMLSRKSVGKVTTIISD